MKKIIALISTIFFLNACNLIAPKDSLTGKKLYVIAVGWGDNPFIIENEIEFISDKVACMQVVLATSPLYFQTKNDPQMRFSNNKQTFPYTFEQSVLTLSRPHQKPFISKLTPIGNGNYEGTERDVYYTTSIIGAYNSASTRERLANASRQHSHQPASYVDVLMNLLNGKRDRNERLVK